ncbi:hypothetical protein AHF37_00637, partial [Paragonimus kellicotti]
RRTPAFGHPKRWITPDGGTLAYTNTIFQNVYSHMRVSYGRRTVWYARSKLQQQSTRPCFKKAFLFFPSGNSVKVRLSRLRLFPLTSLGAELDKLMCRSNACLTFGVLFETVLLYTGTICIGLYRRVQDDIDKEIENTSTEASGRSGVDDQIERYVYTFPESDTPVVPDDLVYCFTAVSDNCEFE